ncbi:hypothetical protein IFM89_013929 [Coptis chinensis]|uniref:Uncharacterized protein n=1 Tax=Coptis chinensis TaxID=261450 RepID=A0A835HBJ9_9MAGN|nr:hypothetical protein IFM89_013929 [Coptis chinensis]
MAFLKTLKKWAGLASTIKGKGLWISPRSILALRSKLRETGTLRMIPNILALIAVQRHAAASRSARPSIRVQQVGSGGEPTLT